MITYLCQLCGNGDLRAVIDLGEQPLADTFLAQQKLIEPESRYPLKVLLCTRCGYATLSYIVPAKKRYIDNEYSYTSSNSRVAVLHFQELAEQIISKIRIGSSDLAVDIGSNDGTLLNALRTLSGCQVIGIEPSLNISRLAVRNNIPTLNHFFDASVIPEILKFGKPKVITATNVFNHVTDLQEFVKNVSLLISDDGVFVFEVPYLLRLVQDRAFDTIYLEHVSYFSIKPLVSLFKKFQMNIFHAEVNDYMGGSIRVYVGKRQGNPQLLDEFIAKEEAQGISQEQTYAAFMDDVRRMKEQVISEITEVKSSGKKIIGIGAATKGNTFLNFCGIDASLLDFITDASPLKVGKYTPGSRIPIKSDEDITPDITHALILPWNIADFLIEKLKHRNLKFIVPKMKK